MYSVTALMPMKGHSERIPGKNTIDFCGRPLYSWVMDSLLASKYVTRIIIDTDSDEIKNSVLKRYPDCSKITIIDRPLQLRGDLTSMADIIRHDISFTDSEDILQTHATCPLLTTETINLAIEKYFKNKEKGSYDSLLTAIRIQSRLYFRDSSPINHKTNVYKRSQDETPVYEENSNIFLFSKDSFYRNNGRIGENPYFYEMDKLESTDIDEKDDLMLAEAVFGMMGNRKAIRKSQYKNYTSEVSSILDKTEITRGNGDIMDKDEAFQIIAEKFKQIKSKKGSIFFAGNGASCSMAEHMSHDFFQNAGINTITSSETSYITAVSNDLSFDMVFAYKIERILKKGDALITISSSGNSPNILKAIEAAKNIGAFVITLSGMSGENKSRKMGDVNIYAPAETYGLAESAHAVLLHYLLDYFLAKDKEVSYL